MVSRTLADQRMSTETSETNEAGSKDAGRKLQLLRAGATRFGIFTEEIAAIVAWQEPTPLPHAPKAVIGVVSIEGRMLTVLQLAALAIVGAAPSDMSNKTGAHLIALRGDEQLALAVDSVDEIITFASNDSMPMPSSTAKPEAPTMLVLGAFQHEGVDINILNPRGLFPAVIQERQRRNRSF